ASSDAPAGACRSADAVIGSERNPARGSRHGHAEDRLKTPWRIGSFVHSRFESPLRHDLTSTKVLISAAFGEGRAGRSGRLSSPCSGPVHVSSPASAGGLGGGSTPRRRG